MTMHHRRLMHEIEGALIGYESAVVRDLAAPIKGALASLVCLCQRVDDRSW
jgi:hypothetical protein